MLGVLHAGPVQFRTGWFVESLATQTLIIFAIRTRRVPFFRSRPGLVLTLAPSPLSPWALRSPCHRWPTNSGFTTLPWQFFTALVLFTIVYLLLVEMMKTVFYADPMHLAAAPHPPAAASTASTAEPPASATPAASATRPAGRPRYPRQSQDPRGAAAQPAGR